MAATPRTAAGAAQRPKARGAARTAAKKRPPAAGGNGIPPLTGAARQLPFDVVALVLQGGGALGAYQAGVYQGLFEAGITPNWVAGISIGAFNTALIAGNEPSKRVERLKAFWDEICRPAYSQPTADYIQAWVERLGGEARKIFNGFEAWRAIMEGQHGFFVPRLLPSPWLGTDVPTNQASFYDTSMLKSTLERLVDFDRINAGEVRVSVGAVNVHNGNFEYFDNTVGKWKGDLRPEHFMASGALPPGFPAVEIEGDFYWDGGLVSNTPLAHVLGAGRRHDTIAFQVDLWSATGNLPTNVFDVQERQKDIQYSSRTRAITTQLHREQKLRHMLLGLLDKLPESVRRNDACCREAQEWASASVTNVIHLIYRDKEWDGLSKDYEFGPLTMRNHWNSGLEDIRATLKHPDWLERPPAGRDFITHDLHRAQGERMELP